MTPGSTWADIADELDFYFIYGDSINRQRSEVLKVPCCPGLRVYPVERKYNRRCRLSCAERGSVDTPRLRVLVGIVVEGLWGKKLDLNAPTRKG
jgi:hypothetical protein